MTGLVQEIQPCQNNHQTKMAIPMAEEQNSQLTCVQSQVKKLKEKKSQLKMTVLDQVHIQLNYQIMFLNILSVHALTQALETKIISDQERLMDLVQVHINYHHQSKLENKQIIESFFFIIWRRIKACKKTWRGDMIIRPKPHLEMLEESSLICHWTTQDLEIIGHNTLLRHLICTLFQRPLITLNKNSLKHQHFLDQDLIKQTRDLLIIWIKLNLFLEEL